MNELKSFIIDANAWPELFNRLLSESLRFGGKIIICLIIYFVGRKLIKYVDRLTGRMMSRKEFDPSVASFLRNLINILLTITLLIAIVNILGINSSSFVALLASIGVALGMALSGTLQNFAGGVMILLFRPYRVGDYVEAQGQGGTVKEIQIFNTVITTTDNRTIYIPNGGLSSNVIVNYNHQRNRRIEWVVGVAYGTDYSRAKAILAEILGTEKRILSDPAPEIVIKALNESSVDIQIRAWVGRTDYWDVYYLLNERIYTGFTEKGIDIPFPQLVEHLAEKGQ
ncbi:MAG: mechanosensitive ion channel [Candidatus Symbiothrix sp.]|jgi:small conductance mechanosensitive channel|nr:mechanosensitive ion channel [Candidatus Symbiothrix sp.]